MAMPRILVKKPGALEGDSSWIHWVNNITSQCIFSYKTGGNSILQADLVKRKEREYGQLISMPCELNLQKKMGPFLIEGVFLL